MYTDALTKQTPTTDHVERSFDEAPDEEETQPHGLHTGAWTEDEECWMNAMPDDDCKCSRNPDLVCEPCMKWLSTRPNS